MLQLAIMNGLVWLPDSGVPSLNKSSMARSARLIAWSALTAEASPMIGAAVAIAIQKDW
jgi:hypothetical protein